MTVRFGLAGLSHFHASTIIEAMIERADVRVLALSEEDYALRSANASKYGLKAYRNAFEMCDAEKPDAVAIVERPDRRADTAARLLSMGIDVLLDKPAAVDRESLAKLAEAARKGPGRLFPYFTVRYERPVAKALELIRSGAIGEVSSFTSMRPHKLLKGIRPGWFWGMPGGVIVDLGIHDIDIYRAACGFGPGERFTAFASSGNFSGEGGEGFVDSAQFMLVPDNGPAGTFLADWLTPEGDPRHGDCAYFIAGTKGRIEVRSTGGIPGKGEALILTAGDRPPTLIEDGPAVPSDIFSDFLSKESGSEMAPGWEDMIIANGIALAAAKAAASGEIARYTNY